METPKTIVQFRLTENEKERIKHGAAEAGIEASQFVLRAALLEAERVLADRRQFVLDDDRYQAFMESLSEPPEPNKVLKKLLSRSAPWD